MKTTTTIFAVATMMVSLSACNGYKSAKSNVKKSSVAPKTADSQCPQNAEGIWKIETHQNLFGQTSYQQFAISRNERGILQIKKGGVVEPIVLDGEPHVLSLTYTDAADSKPSGKTSTFTAKCVEGAINVTELPIAAASAYNAAQIEDTYSFAPSDAEGQKSTLTHGKLTTYPMTKSQPDAGER